MNVLVTGGAGYIGSHTCVELIEAGYMPIVIDNLSNSNPESLHRVAEITGKTVEFIEGDVRDEALLEKIFTEHEISCAIHFAGLKAVGESVAKPMDYYRMRSPRAARAIWLPAMQTRRKVSRCSAGRRKKISLICAATRGTGRNKIQTDMSNKERSKCCI